MERQLNHRRLVEASWKFRPDWLIGLDADERLRGRFSTPTRSSIVRSATDIAFRVHVREIWDDHDSSGWTCRG